MKDIVFYPEYADYHNYMAFMDRRPNGEYKGTDTSVSRKARKERARLLTLQRQKELAELKGKRERK